MKTSIFMYELIAVKMFKPELKKGERNPYTSGDEIGNPYMKDLKLEIKEEDAIDILDLLKRKGYDISKFK